MKLSRVHTLLLIAIIGVNAYVIILPIAPAINFWWHSHHGNTKAHLTQKLHTSRSGMAASASPAETGDRVIVPSMLLDQQVYEGADMRVLNKGLWLRPQASTPDKGGNTVIVGHRFTYTNPRGTLYFLDRVKVGDEVAVFWRGKRYLYRVSKTMVVPPAAVEIEAPTKISQLTLYTCTPLWNPKERLVVTALLEENQL